MQLEGVGCEEVVVWHYHIQVLDAVAVDGPDDIYKMRWLELTLTVGYTHQLLSYLVEAFDVYVVLAKEYFP